VLAAILAFLPTLANAAAYVQVKLADGFDFPVGKPNADGYYKARGYQPQGHHGEDWNGGGGGNTDLGDPVYACGDGIVVQSQDVRAGWGNVIIIRHAYRESDGTPKFIDSLYGHLNTRYVTLHQRVRRGQRIGTIGTNRGMYLAHLHFEIRKNIYIGMHRSKFARGYSNYWDPTEFIRTHRQCAPESRSYQVQINTFQPYPGGREEIVSRAPPPSAVIAKVEQQKRIEIPVEQTKRTASKTTQPRSEPSIANRYIDTNSGRRTLSPTAQQIVAETKRSAPEAAPAEERKTLWSRLKSRAKANENDSGSSKKPIGRRKGLLGRR